MSESLARYKDLCLDAVDADRMAAFWGPLLGLRVEDRGAGLRRLVGDRPEQVVWVNPVPEPVSVKQRVHLDVRAPDPQVVLDLGGSMVDDVTFPWAVMKDPEGGELCYFAPHEGRPLGLVEIVVDCAEPERVARWWGEVLGAEVGNQAERNFWWLQGIPGAPFYAMVFVPVPEPKTVKNRVHWDLVVPDLPPLVEAGATVLREPDAEVDWHVLTDPEGNEFCAFAAP